jgi:hypothetical protein
MRPSNRHRIRAAIAAAVMLAAGPGVARAEAQQGDRFERMTLHTVPRVEGLRLLHRGDIHRTDERGRVTLDVRVFSSTRATPQGFLGFAAPKILRTTLPGGREARFGGYFERGRVIAVSLYSRTGFRYVNLQGRRIDPSRVSSVRLKSRTGQKITLRARHAVLLQASRVVALQGATKSKSIEYSVEEVDVGGGQVVNHAQQRFFPLRTRQVTVPLLLYSAHFTSKDALFGFPSGSAIVLTYPSGKVVRIPLESGEASSGELPRGDYMVRVDAPGMSFERPVALSRDQVVDLEVVSYLDLGVVFSSLAALAIGLILARRPELRLRIRRLGRIRGRARATAG